MTKQSVFPSAFTRNPGAALQQRGLWQDITGGIGDLIGGIVQPLGAAGGAVLGGLQPGVVGSIFGLGGGTPAAPPAPPPAPPPSGFSKWWNDNKAWAEPVAWVAGICAALFALAKMFGGRARSAYRSYRGRRSRRY